MARRLSKSDGSTLSGGVRSDRRLSFLVARGRPASAGGTRTRTGSSPFMIAMPGAVRYGIGNSLVVRSTRPRGNEPPQERENPSLGMDC